MKFPLDRVPVTHEDAVQSIVSSLDPQDIKEINNLGFSPSSVHFSFGMYVRNSWSLWDRKTLLVQHYATRFRLVHADDISGLILDEVVHRVRGRPFDRAAAIAVYHRHWAKHGHDPMASA